MMHDAMIARSARREVMNPVLALPAVKRMQEAPPEVRGLIRELLLELREQAIAKSEESLRKSKYMMFAYWRVVSVYAKHIAAVLK